METGNNPLQANHKTSTSASGSALDWSKSSHSYHLSIEVGLDLFSYAILDVPSQEYIMIESFNFDVNNYDTLCSEIESLIKELDLDNRTFFSTTISLVNECSTLVPNALFVAEKIDTFLSFNHPIEDSDVIKFDDLLNLGAKNVYAVNSSLLDYISSTFPRARLIHFSSSLIEHTFIESKESASNKALVNFRRSTFQLTIMDKNKLVFYNSFKYRAEEDVAYFLLFACEQLKLKKENLELLVAGEIDLNGPIISLLDKYISAISSVNRISLFKYNKRLDFIDKHAHLSLLAQYICG